MAPNTSDTKVTTAGSRVMAFDFKYVKSATIAETGETLHSRRYLDRFERPGRESQEEAFHRHEGRQCYHCHVMTLAIGDRDDASLLRSAY